jgi:hypothetical protein
MTRAGKLMSADRYGINKNDIGPLAKASFEETEKILLRAAVFGEVDPDYGRLGEHHDGSGHPRRHSLQPVPLG